MLTPERIDTEEMLDAGLGTDRDVAENLSDLRTINRYLGGTSTIIRAIGDSLGGDTKPFSLLDVGTGSADIPCEVVEWGSQRGISVQAVAMDLSERNIRVSRSELGVSPVVDMVQADALRIPFAENSFDYVTASLFLHHFREAEVIKLLATFGSIARKAVIVNDLVRNLVPYWFMRISAPLFVKSFLTRNDGPISVLRGFTTSELTHLADEAGLKRYTIRRVFPYRLVLVADQTGVDTQWSTTSSL